MRNAVLLFSLFLLVPVSFAQTPAQLNECYNAVVKAADPDIAPSICAVVLSQLKPDEHVASVTVDGVMTLTDGIIHNHPLPPKLETTLLLKKVTRVVKEDEQAEKTDPRVSEKLGGDQTPWLNQQWEVVRKAYCDYHPGDAYTDLSNTVQVCPAENGIASDSGGNAGSESAYSNVGGSLPKVSGTKTCQKTITFAVAQNGGVTYRLPNISQKWFKEAEKKHRNVCFLQYDAHSGQENYLVVLSSSSSAFNGLQPVFHRDTTMEPVSGSGTLTDNTGGTWDFTYQGTITTTTTTQTNVPYTDTTRFYYANAYREDGSLVATSERTASARQGGDPYNSMGYNLTSALLSIHLKNHLLDEIVKKISATP